MMNRYIPELSEPAWRWVRFGVLLVALALLCWIAYGLRAVFTPLLVALAIAYVLNPVVTWFERRQRVSRLQTVVVVYALFFALVLCGGLYLGSRTVAQVQQFADKVPRYVATIGQWLEALGPETPTSAPVAETQPAVAANDWWTYVAPLVERHGVTVARSSANYLLGFMSNVLSIVTLFLLIPLYTFFFLWRFNDIITTVHDYLPAMYRERIVYFARTTDSSVANFFRGRLIVCLIVGTLTGIGWSLVGVPYSLPLGILAGTLNLVPFMSMLALPPALFFSYIGAHEAGLNWAWPVVLTMGVYMLVQAIESFVLSPTIEGRTSGLHPLAIVIVIMIGAELGGVLGMLLAIPVASTLKVFAVELVLPEIRRLAGRDESPPPVTAAPPSAPPDEPPAAPDTDQETSA